VATPSGEKPIASLVEGDLVYSVHRGAMMAVPIRTTQRMSVTNHFMMRVELADGRIIEISPGHPTADGYSFADLTRGSSLGGVMVVDVKRVPYDHPFTHDILPNSDTGTYFAAGALIGSTMAKPPTRNTSNIIDAY
jgi:hypothetical protein